MSLIFFVCYNTFAAKRTTKFGPICYKRNRDERMKRIFAVLLIIVLLPNAAVYASYSGNTLMCFDFNRVTVGAENNGRYQLDEYGTAITGYKIFEGQIEKAETVSGIWGKGAADKALHIAYNETETNLTYNPWSQSEIAVPMEEIVARGDKIHLYGELADSNGNSDVSIMLSGTTSAGNGYNLSYRQVYPTREEIPRKIGAVFMKYGKWFYYADMGVNGQRFYPEVWYRYDVIIDTENEEYGGAQTIAYYLDGKLHNMGLLDADASSEETDLIKSVAGLRLIIAPRAVEDSKGFYKEQQTDVYLDNLTLNVLRDNGSEPDYRVDGRLSGGSYKKGSIVTVKAENADFFNGIYDANRGLLRNTGTSTVDFDGNHRMIIDSGGSDENVKLFLWERDSMLPLGKTAELVPFNEDVRRNEDFSGLSVGNTSVEYMRSGLSAFTPVYGRFGKAESDCALYVSNPAANVSGAANGEQGIRLTSSELYFGKTDTVTLSFDYAQPEFYAAKSLTANAGDGSLMSIVDFYNNGKVIVLGTQCSDFVMRKNQWYHFDIVLNSDIHSEINTCTAYINGKKYLDNVPFNIGERVENRLTGFGNLKLTYVPAVSDGSLMPDGFYLDNIVIRTMRDSRPQFADFKVSAADALWNMLIDNTSFTVEDYGQDIHSFLDSMENGFVKKGEFVTEHGTPMEALSRDGSGYLRITTDNGYDIYYNLVQGTDETVRDEIGVAGDANPDTAGWYEYEFPDITRMMSEDNPLSAADTIENNIRAHGFVTTNGEYFVGKNDNAHIDFWGTNLIMSGCVPEHDEAEKMADMIAQQGFNLVRLHQITGSRGFIFKENSLELSDVQMDKLCYLLKQLRDRGIYYFIDMDINVFPAGCVNPMPDKPMRVAYFDSAVQNILIDYAERLLTYMDPYDSGRICDNPALAAVACVNETNLFMEDYEKESNFAYYYSELDKMWNEWLQNKYATDLERQAYNKNLKSGESISAGTVKLGKMSDRNNYTDARVKDVFQFLNSVQEGYFGKIKAMMTGNNMQTLLTGTTLFGMLEPQVMKSNLTTDFVDAHNYWAHPKGYSLDTGIELNLNEKDDQTGSMLKDPELGIIQPFMTRKPYNKPYTITEWNTCASSRYLAEGPMLMAAYSKLQNWYPMEFMFTGAGMDNYRDVRISDVFDLSNHPIRIATFPAAALMRKNISEARDTCYTDYSDAQWYDYQAHKPGTSQTQWKNFDMFTNKSAVGMVHKTGVSLLTKPDNTAPAVDASDRYTSDTGELCFDSTAACFTVNTNRSKAAAAFFGGKEISVGNVSFRMDNEFAAIYVNTLDGNTVEKSERILLTAAGKAVNSGQVLSRNGTKVIKQGTAPILVEPIVGEVKIKSDVGDRMKVYILNSSGERCRLIPTEYSDNVLTVFLSESDRTMNYEIVSE